MGDLEKALRAQYERKGSPTFKPGQLGHGIPSAPTPDYLGRAPATPEQIRQAINGDFQKRPQEETVFGAKNPQKKSEKPSQRDRKPKYNNNSSRRRGR